MVQLIFQIVYKNRDVLLNLSFFVLKHVKSMLVNFADMDSKNKPLK